MDREAAITEIGRVGSVAIPGSILRALSGPTGRFAAPAVAAEPPDAMATPSPTVPIEAAEDAPTQPSTEFVLARYSGCAVAAPTGLAADGSSPS